MNRLSILSVALSLLTGFALAEQTSAIGSTEDTSDLSEQIKEPQKERMSRKKRHRVKKNHKSNRSVFTEQLNDSTENASKETQTNPEG